MRARDMHRLPIPPVLVEDVVRRGDQRGRELGFPTANLPVGHDLVRQDGVWAGVVHLPAGFGGSSWIAAISIGRRPTFYGRDGIRLLEAHLVGFRGDLYGSAIQVELHEHLRPMRAFGDAGALIDQLRLDVEGARSWARRSGLGDLLRPLAHASAATGRAWRSTEQPEGIR
ncbi:riboflavin kinase [Pimelobacter simplex]|uniref:riboflavin kinase n=1 Tax=Nocardioides simplex TaxID=2045 RepID=UPI003AACE2AE